MFKRDYKDNLSISLLGLGCMRLPKVSNDSENIDYEKAQEIVDYALANGINYIDTAHMYHGGDSQIFLGKALKKYDRKSFYLATKMPIWSAKTPEEMEKIFNLQLEHLQTNYFDFYLFHSLGTENFKKCVDFGLYEFLQKKKQEGIVRYIGFSFHDNSDALEPICNKYEWDFAQLQINYLDWEMQSAKKQYEILEKYNIPCVVMEPVRGGTLANPCETANQLFKAAKPDMSVASWAIRYVASLPNVITVLSGMSNMEQIIDNVNTLTNFEPLTKDDYKVIDKAVDAYKKKDTVPCTGCRYCMDCPQGVEIPKMFKLYNQYAVDKNSELYKNEYNNVIESERLDNCISCGICTEHCPQNINIPEKLTMVKSVLENINR